MYYEFLVFIVGCFWVEIRLGLVHWSMVVKVMGCCWGEFVDLWWVEIKFMVTKMEPLKKC